MQTERREAGNGHPDGTPRQEILKEARRAKADLLVMGSHGASGIGSVLGSVAFGVLQGQSRVPVLVVRK